jgi:hypothetical protein
MVQSDWFEDDPEFELSGEQRVFLAALRERASSWSCSPSDTQIVEPGNCASWQVVVDVNAPFDNQGLITVGVCFDNASIRASEVHNQTYCPVAANRSRVEAFETTGDPLHLAEAAADWFERILARPVERREWMRDGRAYREYAFADDGTLLGRSGWRPAGLFGTPPDHVVRSSSSHTEPFRSSPDRGK